MTPKTSRIHRWDGTPTKRVLQASLVALPCRSRCPECKRQCGADHRPGDNEGQVGQVYLRAAKVNGNGYPQVWHGHTAAWTQRTGIAAHAWWTRPNRRR